MDKTIQTAAQVINQALVKCPTIVIRGAKGQELTAFDKPGRDIIRAISQGSTSMLETLGYTSLAIAEKMKDGARKVQEEDLESIREEQVWKPAKKFLQNPQFISASRSETGAANFIMGGEGSKKNPVAYDEIKIASPGLGNGTLVFRLERSYLFGRSGNPGNVIIIDLQASGITEVSGDKNTYTQEIDDAFFDQLVSKIKDFQKSQS